MRSSWASTSAALDVAVLAGYPGQQHELLAAGRAGWPAAPSARRWSCWWPATTPWTSTTSSTPRRSSVGRWSTPRSTRATRRSSSGTCCARRASGRSRRPTWTLLPANARALVERLVEAGELSAGPPWRCAGRAAPHADVSLRGTSREPYSLQAGRERARHDRAAVAAARVLSRARSTCTTAAAIGSRSSSRGARGPLERGVAGGAHRPAGRGRGDAARRGAGAARAAGGPAAGRASGRCACARPSSAIARCGAARRSRSARAAARSGARHDRGVARRAAGARTRRRLAARARARAGQCAAAGAAVRSARHRLDAARAGASIVYDFAEGGIGLAEKAYHVLETLLERAATLLRDCPCSDGCPSCMHLPGCAEGNSTLDKVGGLALLEGRAVGGARAAERLLRRRRGRERARRRRADAGGGCGRSPTPTCASAMAPVRRGSQSAAWPTWSRSASWWCGRSAAARPKCSR